MQDCYSAKNRKRLIQVLNNNIPKSNFEQEQKSIGSGGDHVGIFINLNKFENVRSLDNLYQKVLTKNRKTKKDFFTETARAIFLSVEAKNSGTSFLLSCFHAKKNKITNKERGVHIEEFLTVLKGISELAKLPNILVGSDTNQDMMGWEQQRSCQQFCVKIIHYQYPAGSSRAEKGRPVIDFFLVSPSLTCCPTSPRPEVFTEDPRLLDHHPILMRFRLADTVDKPSIPQLLGKTFRKIFGQTEESAGAGSAGVPRSPPGRLTQQSRALHSTVVPSKDKLPVQIAAFSPGPIANPSPSQSKDKRPASTALLFQCELCRADFPSRAELFTHQDRTESHFPCRAEFPGEEESRDTCLRVFSTQRGLSQHRAKQRDRPGHHNPSKQFPNLVRGSKKI